jgi:solute carrier family 24 (sodium/potassium/calcium exchanger), member 6
VSISEGSKIISLVLYAFSFVPALAVISKLLKMGETLAGVTLLAFGNGSPDIFASLAGSEGDTELLYTELLGAATFVTGLIAGIVIVIRPFKVVRRNNLRDVLFFMAAVLYIDLQMHDGYFSTKQGLITCSFYLVYIGWVIADHIWMKKKVVKLRKESSIISAGGGSAFNLLKQVEEIREIVEIEIKTRRKTSVISVKEEPSISDKTLLETFIRSLNPIDSEEWKNSGKLSKLMMAMKVSTT